MFSASFPRTEDLDESSPQQQRDYSKKCWRYYIEKSVYRKRFHARWNYSHDIWRKQERLNFDFLYVSFRFASLGCALMMCYAWGWWEQPNWPPDTRDDGSADHYSPVIYFYKDRKRICPLYTSAYNELVIHLEIKTWWSSSHFHHVRTRPLFLAKLR